MESHDIHFQVHLSRQQASIQKLLRIELVESEKILRRDTELYQKLLLPF